MTRHTIPLWSWPGMSPLITHTLRLLTCHCQTLHFCGNGSPCLLLPRSPTKVLEEEREASRTAQVCPLIAFDVSTFTLNKMCSLYNPIKIISSEDGLEKSPWLLWPVFPWTTCLGGEFWPTPTPPLTNAWHNDTWCSRTKSKRHHSNTLQVQKEKIISAKQLLLKCRM